MNPSNDNNESQRFTPYRAVIPFYILYDLDLNANHFFPELPVLVQSLRSNGSKLQLPYHTKLKLITHYFAFRVRCYGNSLPTSVVAQGTDALFRTELGRYFEAHPIDIKN